VNFFCSQVPIKNTSVGITTVGIMAKNVKQTCDI